MTKLKLLAIVFVMTCTGSLTAKTNDELAQENAQLKNRVEKLENELRQINQILGRREHKAPAKTSSVTPPAATEPKKIKPAGVTIEPYGYIKLDAAYDSSRINNGNFARWAESEATNKNDDQFNMTMNQTRLGLKLQGPDNSEVETSGLIEVDFFGDIDATNKARMQMRHGYMKLVWPDCDFNILAGQTWDVISPLNPYTLNYSVAWWAGNIGYRRPQIRLTKVFDLNEKVTLDLRGAITRNIGTTNSFTGTSDAGEHSGWPGFQARAGIKVPILDHDRTDIGISGHWAKEDLDINAAGNSKEFDSWSINLDVLQPINKWLRLKSELFTGENLSAYFGGIGQGVNTITNREIGSTGGWLAAELGPWDKWRFNFGLSIDDVDNDDLNGISGDKRTYNRSIFGNVIYSLNNNTMIGFELSHWRTEYKNADDGDSLRAQTSFIYKF
ncbi:MAG: DcaP family trimeric outer membrane transporter [Planctomycetota bacterium]|jgi:hypothetical protein